MKHIPTEATGCPRDYFYHLLKDASLSPIPSEMVPKHRICAFIMLLHSNRTDHVRFITRMSGDEFVFLLAIDGRWPGLISEMEQLFASNPDVFIVRPPVPMCWGCASLNYGPWVAIKAALGHGFECDWFSLHSGADVLLHSREVTKAFLLRYRGKAEFYGIQEMQLSRFKYPHASLNGCQSREWLLSLTYGLRHVFPNWTVWEPNLYRQGWERWTLSQRAVTAILDYITHNPAFMLRMSFIQWNDEALVQTVMNILGLTVTNPCDLRFVDWEAFNPHPATLNKTLLRSAWNQFALFARKIDPDDHELVEFIDSHIQQEGPDLPANLVLPPNSTVCGYGEWPTVLAKFNGTARSQRSVGLP
jgi:hypothetical protein